jgi:hypothetical protein
MFGLLVIPVAAGIGLAVDFGRVYAVNNHTPENRLPAPDARAVLAGRADGHAIGPAPSWLQTAASSAVYFGGASTLRRGPV